MTYYDLRASMNARKARIATQARKDFLEVHNQLTENIEKFKEQDKMVFTIKCEFSDYVSEINILRFIAIREFPVTTTVNVVPLKDNLYEITIKKYQEQICVIF